MGGGVRAGGRRLATVHDLIVYMSVRGDLGLPAIPTKQRLLAHESIRQLTLLDHMVTVSNWTADCIGGKLGIPASRVTVIPNHLDPGFCKAATPEERAAFRSRWFGSAEKVVIHVGNATPYKNRIGAIKAFARLRERLRECQMFLVSGVPTNEELNLVGEAGLTGAVSFIPPTSLKGLREIYSAADALVFPSFYEGFGWPPLEAMGCGCPVVSSTRGALAEVVGDAAITTDDPEDYDFIASSLFEILTDRLMASQLRAAGIARSKLFSPERSLALMADLYQEICRN